MTVPETPDPAASGPPPATGPDKALRRATLLARRRSLPPAVWRREAGLLAGQVVAACEMAGLDSAATVCAYVPTRTEPGSTAMLDALRARVRRVLLPVVPGAPAVPAPPVVPGPPAVPGAPAVSLVDAPGRLGWAAYTGPGSLVPGALGIRRPTGPDLGAAAICEAALVLVPALAVDLRGVRLGRGGGWYDRSLPSIRPATVVLAVVRDEEVVDELPHEPHDVHVTGVVTPTAGPRLFPPPLD